MIVTRGVVTETFFVGAAWTVQRRACPDGSEDFRCGCTTERRTPDCKHVLAVRAFLSAEASPKLALEEGAEA